MARTGAGLMVFGLVVLAGIIPTPSHAVPPEFTIKESLVVRIDGIHAEDAAVYVGRRGMLIEIPSQATGYFFDSALGVAFAVRPEQIVGSGQIKMIAREQFAWSVEASLEKHALRFHTGTSEISVVPRDPEPAGKDEEERGSGARAGTGAVTPEATSTAPPSSPTAEMIATPVVPTAPDPAPSRRSSATAPAPSPSPGIAARDCLSLETRPAAGVPGCTRFVFVRNHCEVPVAARVQRTESLMTGTLPQDFNLIVRHEEWLGCSWWSGAMAPAKHDILDAAFLETPPRRAAGAPPRGR